MCESHDDVLIFICIIFFRSISGKIHGVNVIIISLEGKANAFHI